MTRKPKQPTGSDAPGSGDMKIRPVDLDMHGDGINHWQDEPQPAFKKDKAAKQADRKKDTASRH